MLHPIKHNRRSAHINLKGACAAAIVITLLGFAFFIVPRVMAQDSDDGATDGVVLVHTDIQIGSAGNVDDEDFSKILFRDRRAVLKHAAGNTSGIVRFSIQPHIVGEFVQLQEVGLVMRYRDNGPGARVVARLKGWQNSGGGEGTTTTLLTLDSNSSAQADTVQRIGIFDSSGEIDYDAYTAYYVEVTLERSASGGIAELGGIEVNMTE